MTFFQGKAISAEQIAAYCSQDTDEHFAALCNAITWGVLGEQVAAMPSFTERVKVKDKGIDADWREMHTETPTSALAGPGWNVHQYKRRDTSAQDRSKLISNLTTNSASGVKQAVLKLYHATNRRPALYVLYTNIDLSHEEKDRLRSAILDGYDRSNDVRVEIIGAAEMATMLIGLPQVRLAHFPHLPFATWEQAYSDEIASTTQLYDRHLPLIGRDVELDKLRTLIDDPQIRAILISGSQDVGKTFLAFHATEHRKDDTIHSRNPLELTPETLRLVSSPTGETIVIVDDPNTLQVDKLVSTVLSDKALKLVLTLPSADIPLPIVYGEASPIRVFPLGPLNDQGAEALLKATDVDFDYSLQSLIVARAGGNPGVLLAAAQVGPTLRANIGDFERAIARSFENRVRTVHGQSALDALRLLSLLTLVGVNEGPAQEIKLVMQFFGEGLARTLVHDQLPVLQNAGFVRLRGRFAEVLPPLLANAVVDVLLKGRLPELLGLFGALPSAARQRLLDRLQAVDSSEVNEFWSLLVGPEGLVKDLDTVLEHSHMLEPLARTLPQQVVALLYDGMVALSRDERLLIKDGQRHEVLDALEELLFREATSTLALRAIGLLAEAENDQYSNNATGLLSGALHPLHPQMPLSLDTRLNILSEFLSGAAASEMRQVAITAIENYASQHSFITLRPSGGRVPLDAQPDMTWGDIWTYNETLVGLLTEVAKEGIEGVSSNAVKALPVVVQEAAVPARPEKAVELFTELVEHATKHTLPIPIARLADALYRTRWDFERAATQDIDADIRQRIMGAVENLESLRAQLDAGDFATRMERWAFAYTLEDDEVEGAVPGRGRTRKERELVRLAEEAAANPELVTDDILTQLLYDDMRGFSFWRALGDCDTEMTWLPRLLELAASDDTISPFCHYSYGLSRNDPQHLDALLTELTKTAAVSGAAVIYASSHLPANTAALERVEKLINDRRVPAGYVARIFGSGPWTKDLTPTQYLRFLEAVTGPELENSVLVIDCFRTWLHYDAPIEGDLAEFAWRCMESLPAFSEQVDYGFDRLAARLSQANPERGFALLERLLAQPYERNCWNPAKTPEHHEFWSKLLEIDSNRALAAALTARDAKSAFNSWTWRVPELLDHTTSYVQLVEFGGSSQKTAEAVPGLITSNHPEFLSVAIQLIALYPRSDNLRRAMTGVSLHLMGFRASPDTQRLEKLRSRVAVKLSDPNVPAVSLVWLRELDGHLVNAIERERQEAGDDWPLDHGRVDNIRSSAEQAWAASQALRLRKQQI